MMLYAYNGRVMIILTRTRLVFMREDSSVTVMTTLGYVSVCVVLVLRHVLGRICSDLRSLNDVVYMLRLRGRVSVLCTLILNRIGERSTKRYR